MSNSINVRGAPTFADEFNTLNLERQGAQNGWKTAYSWDRYDSHSAHTIFGESEVYVDPTFAGTGSKPLGLNPFSVKDGVLTISAERTPDWAKGSLWNADYTSGVITTEGTFEQTYGYFEMRADLPDGKGSFPAFWLLDDTYNEIDVMEIVNGEDMVWNHVHAHPYEGSPDREGVGFHTTVPNLTDGFHTFGVRWTPETLTWYVDGKEVASTATPATMHKPMYMLANYAVGGSWAGAPDGSELTGMHIDYIRAYSLDGAPVGAPESDPEQIPAEPDAPAPAPAPEPAPAEPAPAPAPVSGATVSISDGPTRVVEGDGGETYAVFTVTRSGDLDKGATTDWSIVGSGGDPASAEDFGGVLPSGRIYFGQGEDTKKIWAPVAGDKAAEAAEGFTLKLANATGAKIGDGSFSATIEDDDGGAAPPASAPPASAPVEAPEGGAEADPGSAGGERFVLSRGASGTVLNFDGAADTLAVPVGSDGFELAGGSSLTALDVDNPWASISGVGLVRWTGAADKADSLADVDGLFEALPGNGTGGALMVAYTETGKVGVYYDADPAHKGGAELVATLDDLTNTAGVDARDFHLFS